MCNIPVAVAENENVVRAVFSHQVGKAGIKPYLFHPGSGPDEVSVMRHSYMGTDACKEQARKITPANPNLKYKGLAIVAVNAVHAVGSQVSDSREGNFCGHAHISHGIVVPPQQEPLHSELKFQLDERLRQLKDHARYFPDPNPTSDAWDGEPLCP